MSFDAAIEIGVFTYLSRDGDLDEIRQELETRGVAPWLAQRVAWYLPIAFGRRVLDGVTLSTTVLDGDVERPFDDDPVWLAAHERAKRAVRPELERIGLGSAEVQAVNQALYAGSKLDDLELGPVAFVEPLLPREAGHGGVPSPLETFRAFLAGHGFQPDAEGRYGSLRIDARTFPRSAGGDQVALQVDFLVSDGRLAARYVVESFAGWGPTWHEALRQTIGKFERGSLHVFIAGLLDRSSCGDQVSWERVEHPGGPFDACVGSQLVLYAPSPVPKLGPLLDELYAALRGVELSRAIHALRVLVVITDGKPTTVEVLLDNEPWPAGQERAQNADWPATNGVLGSRLFVLLLPAE